MPKYHLLIFFIIINFSCNENCITFKQNTNNIFGIDVSHYQNEKSNIDWEQVKENKTPKIQFAYIRSTMGKDGLDKQFKNNFHAAKKQGIKVGTYHYFRPDENGADQFKNFKKHNEKIGDLPPVVDIEERSFLGGKKLKKELLFFLKKIEEEYLIKPIIYAPQKFYNIYLRGSFKNYQFWIARQNGASGYPESNKMNNEPYLLDSNCPVIWQYSGTGKIKGITGPVDLNVFKKEFWEKHIK